MTSRRRATVLRAALLRAAVLAGLLALAGCGGDSEPAPSVLDDPPAATGTALDGTLTVSAATSLTGVLTEIGDRFEAAHPGVEVTFNFDASSALAAQIVEGAPVDVFASADEANMAKLTDPSLVADEPQIFARNELVIVTKPGNPEGIDTLADLADAGVISLCGAEVPCGKYAAAALSKAGVTVPETGVTRGQNAGATLQAVAEGDAVAGIVYVTDVEGAGDTVDSVPIPADLNVGATYPVAPLAATGNPAAAAAFVEFLLGDDGQAVLKEYGFLPPA